ELQAVDVALPVFHRRDHAGFGRGADGEAGWRFLHAVAMAHPGHELALDTREEAAAVIAQRRLPVLADARAALYATRGDPSAELARYQLHAVADGEDRHAEPEQAFRHAGSLRCVDTAGPAGEDDAGRREPLERGKVRGRRDDRGVDVELAQP